MYTIIKLQNGKFQGVFRLQDGTERYLYDTLEEAVKGAKEFAKFMNGARGKYKLKRSGITFLQEQPVTKTCFVEWVP